MGSVSERAQYSIEPEAEAYGGHQGRKVGVEVSGVGAYAVCRQDKRIREGERLINSLSNEIGDLRKENRQLHELNKVGRVLSLRAEPC